MYDEYSHSASVCMKYVKRSICKVAQITVGQRGVGLNNTLHKRGRELHIPLMRFLTYIHTYRHTVRSVVPPLSWNVREAEAERG